MKSGEVNDPLFGDEPSVGWVATFQSNPVHASRVSRLWVGRGPRFGSGSFFERVKDRALLAIPAHFRLPFGAFVRAGLT
jgi:hypothetical protein